MECDTGLYQLECVKYDRMSTAATIQTSVVIVKPSSIYHFNFCNISLPFFIVIFYPKGNRLYFQLSCKKQSLYGLSSLKNACAWQRHKLLVSAWLYFHFCRSIFVKKMCTRTSTRRRVNPARQTRRRAWVRRTQSRHCCSNRPFEPAHSWDVLSWNRNRVLFVSSDRKVLSVCGRSKLE